MSPKKWKILSYIAVFLFVIQMGYIFTGRIIHEILGVGIFFIIIIHMIQKKAWIQNIKKQPLMTKIIYCLLAIDLIVLLLSALNVSTVIFPFIHLDVLNRDVHKYSAIFGCVLIVFHVGFSLQKKSNKKRRTWIIMIALSCVVFVAGLMGLPYLNRHFKEVNVGFQQVIQGDKVHLTNHRVLTVYFSRVGNSDFEEDVDAVSGASLMKDDETLIGNAQLLAYMVQDCIGGDIAPIETVYQYPSGYGETTKVAMEEFRNHTYPELKQPISVDNYDVVILVYPLWWNTAPNAVISFLKNTEWNGQTIVPIITQGSSGFGTSVEDMREFCQKARMIDGELSIYCEDIPHVRDEITEYFSKLNHNQFQ